MYLTAQKVISPHHQTGINAFLHLHVDDTFPVGPLTEEAVILVTEARTGILLDELIELVPGGNRVSCFLDVVAPDRTNPKDILGALDEFDHLLSNAILPIVRVIGNIGIRLNADVSLWSTIRQEFGSLRERIQLVLERLPPVN